MSRPGPRMAIAYCPRTFRREFRWHQIAAEAVLVVVVATILGEAWILFPVIQSAPSLGPTLVGLWILIGLFTLSGAWTAYEASRPPPSRIRLTESGLDVDQQTVFGVFRAHFPWSTIRGPTRPYGARGEYFVRFVLSWIPPRTVALNLEPELYSEIALRVHSHPTDSSVPPPASTPR